MHTHYNTVPQLLHSKSDPVLAASRQSTRGAAGGSGLAQSLTVEVVLPVARSDPLQYGKVVTKLLDAFYLLVEEVTFNEVRHLLKKNWR